MLYGKGSTFPGTRSVRDKMQHVAEIYVYISEAKKLSAGLL